MSFAIIMTSPSVICFSACLAALLIAQPLSGGTVSGSVRVTASSAAHDPHAPHEPRDLSGAVVWLEPLHSVPAQPPTRERILQKNKMFQPHVLAIPVGSTVDFPNLDPIFHNAFSTFNGQVFDIGLYPPGKSRAVVFRRPGIVRVFCNIHPSMSAVIVVVPSPWFATTAASGHFSISNVPPGSYRRHVFYERATPETLHNLEAQIEVTAPDTHLPEIAISEAGYISVAHANKHGAPYPRDPSTGYGLPE